MTKIERDQHQTNIQTECLVRLHCITEEFALLKARIVNTNRKILVATILMQIALCLSLVNYNWILMVILMITTAIVSKALSILLYNAEAYNLQDQLTNHYRITTKLYSYLAVHPSESANSRSVNDMYCNMIEHPYYVLVDNFNSFNLDVIRDSLLLNKELYNSSEKKPLGLQDPDPEYHYSFETNNLEATVKPLSRRNMPILPIRPI